MSEITDPMAAMLRKYCISPYSLGTNSAAMINQKTAVIPEPPALATVNKNKLLIFFILGYIPKIHNYLFWLLIIVNITVTIPWKSIIRKIKKTIYP